MCLFQSKQKAPEMPTPVAPAPQPVPQPSDTSPTETSEQRRRRNKALQYGVLSTIKTGPQGTTGAGPDLAAPAAGGFFSSSGPFGAKKNLGQ